MGVGKPETTFSMPQRCPLPPQGHGTGDGLHPAGLPWPQNSVLQQRFFPHSTPSAPQISCLWIQSNVGAAPAGRQARISAARLHRWLCLSGWFPVRLAMHMYIVPNAGCQRKSQLGTSQVLTGHWCLKFFIEREQSHRQKVSLKVEEGTHSLAGGISSTWQMHGCFPVFLG